MQNLIYSEENVKKKNHNVAIVSFTWLTGKIKMSVLGFFKQSAGYVNITKGEKKDVWQTNYQ